MTKDAKILIIGNNSLTGAALVQRLKEDGFKKILIMRSEPNLMNQRAVQFFFKRNKPDYVFLAGVKSGGIMANCNRPAEFIYANLQVQNNVIQSALETKVKRLLFVASSCVYPKNCLQPMKEEYLLTGPLEPTSEAFAVAKLAGIKMCQFYNKQYGTNFISVIPATVYGKNDDFNPEASHVLPALMRKIYEAKIKKESTVTIWGTGKPRREFLHVGDMVDACIYLMKNLKAPEVINVGTGSDISICELAELLKEIVGFKGRLKFDTSKPDGVPQKLLDTRRLKSLGWTANVDLKTGLKDTYNWYKANASMR